MRNDQDLFDL